MFKRGAGQSVTNRSLHVSDASSQDELSFALVLLTLCDLTTALTAAKTRAQATLLATGRQAASRPQIRLELPKAPTPYRAR